MLEHWESALAVIFATIGCCWFLRRETKEQIRESKEGAEKRWAETRALIASLERESRERMARSEQDFKDFREKWAEESKDFHARLSVQDSDFKSFLREYTLSKR